MSINRESLGKVIALYGSSALGIGLGFAISVFNTNVLGKESYGDYKYIETVFRFVASVVSVGIFISITRMLAIAKNKLYEHSLIGLFVLTLIMTSLIGAIFLIIFSYFQPTFFENDLGNIFRKYSFLIIPILGNIALGEILKGLNKIYTIAIFSCIPGILYLLLIYIYNLNNTIILENILLLYYGIQFIYMILIIYKLKPNFDIKKEYIKDVIIENNTNGRPIYYGSLAGVATAHLAGFALSYYVDNIQVGFFTLAMTICSPILIVPSVLGTTFFKNFATSNFIPKKVIYFSILMTILALIIFYSFFEKIFLLFFSEEFTPTIRISKILVFGFLLHGFGDLINRFLGANGQGVMLRNAAFTVGVVNVLGYVIMVNYFGVMGAIITKIIASGVYLLMMAYFYNKFTKNIKNV